MRRHPHLAPQKCCSTLFEHRRQKPATVYRGLLPLEAADAGIFFGREAPTIEALDRLPFWSAQFHLSLHDGAKQKPFQSLLATAEFCECFANEHVMQSRSIRRSGQPTSARIPGLVQVRNQYWHGCEPPRVWLFPPPGPRRFHGAGTSIGVPERVHFTEF
jgi:hypothetical protein